MQDFERLIEKGLQHEGIEFLVGLILCFFWLPGLVIGLLLAAMTPLTSRSRALMAFNNLLGLFLIQLFIFAMVFASMVIGMAFSFVSPIIGVFAMGASYLLFAIFIVNYARTRNNNSCFLLPTLGLDIWLIEGTRRLLGYVESN